MIIPRVLETLSALENLCVREELELALEKFQTLLKEGLQSRQEAVNKVAQLVQAQPRMAPQ